MRLPADRIRQGILHTQREVREAAVSYFSDAFLADSGAMPMVIQAVDQYGFAQAFSPERVPENLTQSAESVRWLLSLVTKIAQSSDRNKDEYRMMYSFLLAGADLELLAAQESAIMACEAFHERARRVVYERLQLRDASPDKCWAELEDFCKRHEEDDVINEADLVYAYALVDALARRGESQAPRVMEVLKLQIGDAETSALGWMEGLAVRLAGEMRLAAAVPQIIAKMHLGGEWLSDECQRALIQLGSDDVVRGLATDYPQADLPFREFAAITLERIYSDESVRVCRELHEREIDFELRILLLYPLISNFDTEGLEFVRQYLRHHPLPAEWADLKTELIAAATLMKIDFPERRSWEEEGTRQEKQRQVLRGPEFPVIDSIDELLARQQRVAEQQRKRQEQALATALPLPSSLFRKKTKVGRNDPCPCGSGKKYKACCMRGKA